MRCTGIVRYGIRAAAPAAPRGALGASYSDTYAPYVGCGVRSCSLPHARQDLLTLQLGVRELRYTSCVRVWSYSFCLD